MPDEIERKFLVDRANGELRDILAQGGTPIRQAYFRDPSIITVDVQENASALEIRDAGQASLRVAIPIHEAQDLTRSLCKGEGDAQRLSECVARVRIAGDRAWITIKGATTGITRQEFEYEIAASDAEQLLDRCGAVLSKTRFTHPLPGDLVAEIDVFHQIDLIIAEVEIPNPSTIIAKPDWFTEDVSHDPRYFNSAIAAQLI